MALPQARARVGLVYQSAALPDHLKQALEGVGIEVVLEARYADFNADSAAGMDLKAVIVNLDNDDDDALLDQVSATIESLGCELVFNDALASGALSGWDQARWARHLASKVAGAGDIHPPRPEGAQPIPVPAAAAPSLRGEAPPPGTSPRPVSDAAPAAPETGAEDGHVDANSAVDEALAALEAALSAPDQGAPSAVGPGADEAKADAEAAPTSNEAELFDRLAEAIRDVPAAAALEPADPAGSAESADALDDEVDALVALIEDVPDGVDLAAGAASDAFGAAEPEAPVVVESELDFELELGDDTGAGFAQFSEDVPSADGLELDDEAAALAAQLEAALAEQPGANEAEDFDPAKLSDVEPARASAAGPAAPSSRFKAPSGLNLELAPLDDAPGPAEANPPPAAPARPALSGYDFSGLSLVEDETADTVSASAAQTSAGFDFSRLNFELEPVDDGAADAAAAAGLGAGQAAGLAPQLDLPVWVLGASIGGPEAVREFLAGLPAGCPAVFVLVQHMGAEFQDLMTQQLDRATPLRVRLARDGERAEAGDVIVVPVGKRFRMLPDGSLRLDDQLETAQYNPCIDEVLRQLLLSFGPQVNAIVFSGMARDAIEGCVELAQRGGKVWVQDPSTCVISSMIDGVRERRLDSFMGSPAQLASELRKQLGC